MEVPMDKEKGKRGTGFPVLWILLTFLLFSGLFLFPVSENNERENGKIRVGAEYFRYQKSHDAVYIANSQNQPVFSFTCREENTILLNLGFSRVFRSFFVFKEKFDLPSSSYELSLELENETVPVISRARTAFYTPLLVEVRDNCYVVYIGEDFSITVIDLSGKRQIHGLAFTTPVIKLALGTVNHREVVEFYRYTAGKYRKHFFYLEDIETGTIHCRPFDLNDAPGEGPKPGSPAPKAEISLDYKKFIGFGDSITYGYINKEEAPELGYIPRLQLLLREWLYDGAEVINEGEPGTITEQALEWIEPVILEHRGKYLLFHYGTNDVVHPGSIPASVTVFNIETMIKKALEYNVQPILTTLIPRNGGKQEELNRQRGLAISEGIQEIAASFDIPLIDLWNLFLNYPEGDGGYMSLMSDNVHPSEKGYQLMAEEWLNALLSFPPLPPGGITVYQSQSSITILWPENEERDVNHYVVKFGYSPNRLNRIVNTFATDFIFKYNPLSFPFQTKIYFQVQAVDNGGNGSEFTPIREVEFKTDNLEVSLFSPKGNKTF
jgi:lysophospholipase L1-like esterase